MALKTRLNPDEHAQLPESVQGVYRPSDDGSEFLVDLEGISDVDSLLSAFERQKREHAELKARLSLAKDATPENHAALQVRLEELETAIAGYGTARAELEQRQAEELTARDAQILAMERDLADLREDEVARHVERRIAAAIEAAGGDFSTQLLLAAHIADRTRARRDERGEIAVEVIDRDGMVRLAPDGRPLSIESLVVELKLLDSALAKAFPGGSRNGGRNGASGSGAP